MPPEGYVENGYLNVVLVDPDRRPAIRDDEVDEVLGVVERALATTD